MDFRFTQEDEAFRREICDWLTAEITPEFEFELEQRYDERGFQQAFSKKLADKGWLTFAWPKEYGGQAGSHIQQALLHEELGYHHAPSLAHIVGVDLVGPVLMVHGTEEQKREHLPPIARMDHVYAQGFTEPDAGSDVASLTTRAVEDGDNYIVNGHKIFIGNAHLADTCFLAARTDMEAQRHRGISLFMVPLDTPGIDVRPIPTIDGHQVNAIYFDDVIVPKERMVAEKNRGWYAMATTLDFERSGVGGASGAKRTVEDIIEFAREVPFHGKKLIDDPVFLSKVSEFAVEVEVHRLLCWRIVAMQAKGLVPTVEGTMSGLIGKLRQPKIADLAADVLGRYAGLTQDEERWAPLHGRLERLVVRGVLTHPGGTPEILKNVLANRGLGLPRA
ncbi:MAG: acyl-CoA dehydrogenase family protein [Dehalococcoidia bacterium]